MNRRREATPQLSDVGARLSRRGSAAWNNLAATLDGAVRTLILSFAYLFLSLGAMLARVDSEYDRREAITGEAVLALALLREEGTPCLRQVN